jgi:hypothetical protein
MLIFLVGALLGVLTGGFFCVRYLRREIAADIGPRLRRIEQQLANLETAVNLALVTQYAELSGRIGPLPLGATVAPPLQRQRRAPVADA